MNKWTFVVAAVLWPLGAFAGPDDNELEILSPVADSCVNNGGFEADGGQAGGQVQPEGRDVPLRFRVNSPGGAPVSVTFLTEWTEFRAGLICADGECVEGEEEIPRSEQFGIELFFEPGETEIVTGDFPVPGFLIGDGVGTRITLRTTSLAPDGDGAVLAEDSVEFTLDRIYPVVEISPEALGAAQSVCAANPAAVNYSVTDNITPSENIAVSEEFEIDGCRVRRIITMRDACGNGNVQTQDIVNYAPAGANNMVVNIQGFECDPESCDLQRDDIQQFEDGARVSRPTFAYEVTSPRDCVATVEAVIMPAELEVDVCPVLDELPDNACNDANDCAGDQACNEGICTEPEACAADVDCLGNRRCLRNLCTDPCTSLQAGRALERPGDYVARVRVGDCSGAVAEDRMTVTVLEKPVANPGGNLENGDYQVEQGTSLFLDGSTSSAPAEIGGIVQYAWDLNNDGFFDADTEIFMGDEPEVAFDTSVSGTFNLRLMVTAGNGTSAVTRFRVIVDDVDPICDAGGEDGRYEIEEGQPLQLDGSGSQPGHESDPIVAYDWDFGDNRNPQRGARLENPLHIYGDAQAEPFIVTLTVEDVDSSSSCTAEVVVVDVVPRLGGIEALNPQAQIEGELVRFTVDAEAGSQADPLSNFAWTFGPVNARREGPAERTTEWTYPDDGTYNVCVTVSDEDSNVDICQDFVIADLEPTASFTGPAGGSQGEMLTFDATLTSEGGAADQLTELVWDWGDGSALERVNPNQRVASHTFVQDGEFTITLRALDEDSAAEFRQTVNIRDAEPLAQLRALFPGDDRSIPEGVNLLLDASESEAGSDTDPIVEYDWDFGNGVTREGQRGQPGFQYAWPDQGIFEVEVTVRDIDGSESTARTIVEVTNVAPTVELVAEERQVAIGEPIRFETISGALPQGDGPRIFAVVEDVAGDLPPPPGGVVWEMGDGSTVNAATHEYVFNELGTKRVTVTVEDGDGGTAEATIELEVTPAAPAIQDLPAQSVREGDTLEFELNILAPRLNPQEFDIVDVNILEEPPGATIDVIDEGPHKRLQVRWTPTFYDSGYHRLWIRANSSAAERMRVIDINVDEAGVPRIAAIGGTANRGVLTFYDYERTPGGNGVVLRSGREVELGHGTAAAHVDADGSRVWVAVPGSNMVAVVSSAGSGSVIRRIPVGSSPQGLAYGGGRLWVANHGDNTISAIDTNTMKVEFTIELDGEVGPSDLAWLGTDVAGVDEERLVVVTDGSGHLITIDPEAARSGIRPIVSSQQIGGILSRVVIDASTGHLFAADSKTRRVYRVDTAELADGEADVAGIELDFAARDLLARDGTLWAATGLNLVEIQGDEVENHELIQARALGVVGDAAVSGGAIAVATANRLENYMADTLNRVTETGGTRIRRIVTLVAPR